MRVFNMATEAVKQGGTRRGANMGILRVDHPDILEFIDCKKVNGDITNFNISVGITEAFMQAVEENRDYDLIDPQTRRPVGKRSARELFEKIVDAAWRNGEPGIIFLDRLNRDNVVPSQGEIESTNPCGEQPAAALRKLQPGQHQSGENACKNAGRLCRGLRPAAGHCAPGHTFFGQRY